MQLKVVKLSSQLVDSSELPISGGENESKRPQNRFLSKLGQTRSDSVDSRVEDRVRESMVFFLKK